MVEEKRLAVQKWTIIRTIAVVLVVARTIARKFGYEIPMIDESVIVSGVDALLEIGIIVTGFWYNNSFSEAALKADEYMKKLREIK